jgi:hypothetical protein
MESSAPRTPSIPVPLLAVPMMPRKPDPPAEAVAAVVGPELAEPLVRLGAAIVEAKAAVAVLESGRRGTFGDPGWGGSCTRTFRAAHPTVKSAGAGPRSGGRRPGGRG